MSADDVTGNQGTFRVSTINIKGNQDILKGSADELNKIKVHLKYLQILLEKIKIIIEIIMEARNK